MGFLVACMNEEDPIKNEGARVVTTLFINFSDAQGQLTPMSVMQGFSLASAIGQSKNSSRCPRVCCPIWTVCPRRFLEMHAVRLCTVMQIVFLL